MNQKVAVNGVTYQVTATKGTPTVKYVSTTSKSTKITIPSKVTAISAKALKNNKKVTTVVIPSTVKTIGANAFQGCTKLSKVAIPSSVTSIGASAFYGCTKLTKINIPSKVTTIGKKAFYGAKNLKTISINGKNISKVNTGAFKGINKKAVIKITGSLTKSKKTALVNKIKKSGVASTVTVK